MPVGQMAEPDARAGLIVITKRQLLQAVVGLIEVNDYQLLSHRPALGEIAHPDDFELVGRIARTVKSLYDDFDYTESPEFLRSIEGKSDRFAEMKRRLASDPQRRAEQRDRLAEALVELPDTTRLLALVPQRRRVEVDEITRWLSALRNPDPITN